MAHSEDRRSGIGAKLRIVVLHRLYEKAPGTGDSAPVVVIPRVRPRSVVAELGQHLRPWLARAQDSYLEATGYCLQCCRQEA